MKKPRLSFWQIWNMSFGFLGIQFGFALQNANVSRIFETLGANIDQIPILWIAAPVTGLIIQPIIGYMSDRTWGRLGRRRPYFLTGAILASLGLIIMPNSPFLWVAAGLLWIMDASINVSMEPFRALVADNLPSVQRTTGFALQSFFIGLGAVVASVLPYVLTNFFNIANTAPSGEIPESVAWSFYIGAAVFISGVLWTVFRTREYSPEEMEAFDDEQSNPANTDVDHDIVHAGYAVSFLKTGWIWIIVGLVFAAIVYYTHWEKELYILSGLLGAFGFVQLISSFLIRRDKADTGLVHIIVDLYEMPSTMRQLAFIQFFSWFAMFAMWIYSTAAVTHHIYGTDDPTSALYNQGANWVGVLFGVYNGFAAVVAFLLSPFAKMTSRKVVHSISLVLGGLGLISFYFISSPHTLIISELGIGVAWASILAMPYAILAGALPQKKMGVYMGIFNFFIVLPQITAAGILGPFIRHLFNNEAIYALVLGGISLLIAAVMTLFVHDVDDVYAEIPAEEVLEQ
jgi:maltose/moltooligosaccharide transporter